MNGLMDEDVDVRTKLNHGATFQMACGMSIFSISTWWFFKIFEDFEFVFTAKMGGNSCFDLGLTGSKWDFLDGTFWVFECDTRNIDFLESKRSSRGSHLDFAPETCLNIYLGDIFLTNVLFLDSNGLLLLVWNHTCVFSNWNNIASYKQQSHLINDVLNSQWFSLEPTKPMTFPLMLFSMLSLYIFTWCFFVCQDPLSIIMDHCRGAIKRWDVGPLQWQNAVELDQWSVEIFWLVTQPPHPRPRTSPQK